MGTMGMVIRRGLGELGPFLFVFRRRAPVFGARKVGANGPEGGWSPTPGGGVDGGLPTRFTRNLA